MRRIGAIVLLIGSLAACDSSHPHAANPPTSPSSSKTAPTLPSFDAVLDDTGLHLPAGPTPAAKYRISFEDRRTHQVAGKRGVLQFLPSGPQIVVLAVPAGTSADGTLIANLVARVAINGQAANVPIDHPLDVQATPQYPTPAT